MDDRDPGVGERRHQPIGERRVETLDEVGDPRHDVLDLLRRCPSVGRGPVESGGDLVLQRPDAHLEELVEVGRHDRAELGPLEQRDPRLGREFEHPVVEREPAQLTVEEAFVEPLA